MNIEYNTRPSFANVKDANASVGLRPITVPDHALYYASIGWSVFPVPVGTKKSHKSAKYSDGRKWGAARNPDEIRSDYAQWPDANVGIPTGADNGFFVVEADTPKGHGVDGLAELAKMSLPPTLQSESPSGSVHCYFRHPGDRKIKNSSSELAAGIDVRGDGGMVLAPPSVKPGVGVYKWRNALPIADAPEWLLDKVTEREKPKAEKKERKEAPAAETAEDKIAQYDLADTKGLYQFMADNGCIVTDDDWYQAGMVARLEFGAAGLELWKILCRDESGLSGDSLARWNSFDSTATSDAQVTLLSLTKKAHVAGWKGTVRRSLEAMFGGLTFDEETKTWKITGPEPVVSSHPVTILPALCDIGDAGNEDAADDFAWLAPKPFVWQDPKTLPRMQWLYGRTYLRGTVYMTVAAPGVGKTARKLVDALALVSGRVLLHDKPVGPLKVWHLNGEEPADILQKRVTATMMAHSIPREDVEGRLFLNDLASRFIIARQTKDGVIVMEPVRDALIAFIRANQIDVVQIDPFISSHAVPENENGPIDLVVKTYADIALATGCAIDLVHHARKTNGMPVTFEDARGASAAGGAVRGGDVQNTMTKEEAAQAGIEEGSRKRYVRIDDGKANHAPQGEKAKWLKIESVDLGNGDFFNPGDSMPVVKAWHWPDLAAGIAPEDITKAQEAVAAGRWRENAQANDWVGKAIAGALGLDLENKADKAKVKGLIKRWLTEEYLVRVMDLDEKSKPRPFIEVGKVAKKSPDCAASTAT